MSVTLSRRAQISAEEERAEHRADNAEDEDRDISARRLAELT